MADEKPTFETFIASERARITGERDKLVQQKTEIDGVIATLDRELRAIAAYEQAKTGSAPATTTRAAPSAPGGRRTGQREAVLAVIEAHPDGIAPAQILVQMQANTDAEKTSVRNALSALKRNNNVATKDGKYIPA